MTQAVRLEHGSSEFRTTNAEQLYDYLVRGFGARSFDAGSCPDSTWTIRSICCGALTLGYSHSQSQFRVTSGRLPQLLFSFNAWGVVGYSVDQQAFKPPAGQGVLLATPGETDQTRYVRAPGEGNFISLDAASLVAVAKAINGPMAGHQLQERLANPLVFTPFAGNHGSVYARSLIDILRLIDGLLKEGQSLPTALCLDDLIQRQLVLMLCPDLAHAELPGQSQGSERHF